MEGQSFKNVRTLKEHFEIHQINYHDKNSHSFISWQATFVNKEYTERDIFFEALLKRDNYLLHSTVLRLVTKFRAILKELEGVKSNEYLSLLLLNDYAFKSPVINKFGFAFHLKFLLRFYRNEFLRKQNKNFFEVKK